MCRFLHEMFQIIMINRITISTDTICYIHNSKVSVVILSQKKRTILFHLHLLCHILWNCMHWNDEHIKNICPFKTISAKVNAIFYSWSIFFRKSTFFITIKFIINSTGNSVMCHLLLDIFLNILLFLYDRQSNKYSFVRHAFWMTTATITFLIRTN